MKSKVMFLMLLIVSVIVLGGCQPPEPAGETNADSVSVPVASDSGQLDRDWQDRELQGINSLSLGTFELEGTADAVTPEQAAKLLPLWQMIQSGSLQSAAETDAVVKQIEDLMTDAQHAAIAAMDLTVEDTQVWLAEQGIEVPVVGGGPGGGSGPLANMSEQERAALREKMQGMRDLSPEERATAMAEMGIERPEGAQGGQGGGFGIGQQAGGMRSGNVMLDSLIELLTERAAE